VRPALPESRLAEILESSLDAIWAGARDARIVSWNPAAERSLGYGHRASAQHTVDDATTPVVN
jgi:PAS domain S-box-containing protein